MISHTNDRPSESRYSPVLPCASLSSSTALCTWDDAIAIAEQPGAAVDNTEREEPDTLRAIRAAGVILYRDGKCGAFAPGGGFVGCTPSAAEAQRLIDAAKGGVAVSDAVATRKLSELRAHPENASIFGDPEESEQFEAILGSIRKHGIWEPLVIKADGTILAGHLRRLCAERLKLATVPVRVAEPFETYRDELTFVIRSNTDRRQLTKGELAVAFKRLRNLPAEDGGAKKRVGRPEGSARDNNGGPRSTISKSRDDAAKLLGVGPQEARALETVFNDTANQGKAQQGEGAHAGQCRAANAWGQP